MKSLRELAYHYRAVRLLLDAAPYVLMAALLVGLLWINVVAMRAQMVACEARGGRWEVVAQSSGRTVVSTDGAAHFVSGETTYGCIGGTP